MTELERRLLDRFQDGLPMVAEPFAAMARELDVSEAEVIASLQRLQDNGTLSRVGAVFRPHSVGASTLAAMAVPPERLEAVAELVSSYEAVNHNYEREHELNLWFVVAAADQEAVAGVLTDIEQRTGLTVLDLPLERSFHIDLGFRLWR